MYISFQTQIKMFISVQIKIGLLSRWSMHSIKKKKIWRHKNTIFFSSSFPINGTLSLDILSSASNIFKRDFWLDNATDPFLLNQLCAVQSSVVYRCMLYKTGLSWGIVLPNKTSFYQNPQKVHFPFPIIHYHWILIAIVLISVLSTE